MTRTWYFIAAMLITVGISPGCHKKGPGGEETIEVKPPNALARAKTILENYANGSPMSSEATSFPGIVEEVRKTDPAKAEFLEKGFKDLQNAKGVELSVQAKELLKKL